MIVNQCNTHLECYIVHLASKLYF